MLPANLAPIKTVRGTSVCVAANHLAAEAGVKILKSGGNAFDAAAAAGFVEAVIAPGSCGIGGYGAAGIGFVAKRGEVVAIDANTVAPRLAHPELFPVAPARDPNSYRPLDDRHKKGSLSVGVPGVLGGLVALVENWGNLPLEQVMAPAIEHAAAGVRLTPGQALTWLTMKAESEGTPLPQRSSIPAIVPMDDLKRSLEMIARGGYKVFYEGEIGQKIADHVEKRGGMLRRSDMAAYRPKTVPSVRLKVGPYELHAAPPSAGGLTSIQAVAILDRLRSKGRFEDGSVDELEAKIEVFKVVWTERLTTLTDSPFMTLRPELLLADAHLGKLLDQVDRGLKKPEHGRIVAPDPLRGTVHLCAADAEGNVVSWTQTHGGGFGAVMMVPGTGIVLGHGMCRFEPRPGWANSIAPGKRPLHNMSPVLALRDGKSVLALGAAGARTIVNNVATIAYDLLVRGLTPEQAMTARRIQLETMEPVVLERSFAATAQNELERRGHLVKSVNLDGGAAQFISATSEGWIAVAESRTLDAGSASV